MMRGAFMLVAPQQNDRGGDHNVRERNREEQFPAEGHQLVITETGQGAPHPDIDEEEKENLAQEPEGALNEFVDEWEGYQNRADHGEYRAEAGEDDAAENGFVADAVPDDPEAEGDENRRRKIMREGP